MRKLKRYGLIPDMPDKRDLYFSKIFIPPTALPISVDLRPEMPPVYDQLQLGSCTANALGGAIHYDLLAESKGDFIPSRLFIYYNERVREDSVDQDAGAQIRDGIKTLADQGVCQETEWPYDISQFTVKPSDKCYTDALQYTALKYLRVSPVANQIKHSLALKIPVVCGISLYQSFESEGVTCTGLVDMPKVDEQMIGGHAVLCVGYNDMTQKWIMRNSWGEGWGDKGYFTLPYDYLTDPDLVSDMWAINLVK